MNLFDKVMKGASVRRLGDLNLVNLGAQRGTMLVEAQDFLQARKWAQQKQASGNDYRDFQQLLDRIEVYVPRYGSGFAAKGHANRLLRLARAMQSLGLNHEDWAFPRSVADEMRKRPGVSADPASGRNRPGD